ncbi:ATP11 protein-domain-containing protein, partial [Dimargaris cristalligena]
LDQILNMEKMAEADAETVGKLWTEYHAQKNHLSAVIPAGSYRELYQRTSRYPRFVLPVPHADGIEVYYCQFHFHQAYFTPLLEYKTHGESAKTYLTLTNYTEFLDSKGIVLMRGELTDPKLPLSMDSAHLLTLAVQQFYLTGSAAKKQLVEVFNNKPVEFDFDQLLAEFNKLD